MKTTFKALAILALIGTAHADDHCNNHCNPRLIDDLYTEIEIKDSRIENLEKVIEILEARIDSLSKQEK